VLGLGLESGIWLGIGIGLGLGVRVRVRQWETAKWAVTSIEYLVDGDQCITASGG